MKAPRGLPERSCTTGDTSAFGSRFLAEEEQPSTETPEYLKLVRISGIVPQKLDTLADTANILAGRISQVRALGIILQRLVTQWFHSATVVATLTL